MDDIDQTSTSKRKLTREELLAGKCSPDEALNEDPRFQSPDDILRLKAAQLSKKRAEIREASNGDNGDEEMREASRPVQTVEAATTPKPASIQRELTSPIPPQQNRILSQQESIHHINFLLKTIHEIKCRHEKEMSRWKLYEQEVNEWKGRVLLIVQQLQAELKQLRSDSLRFNNFPEVTVKQDEARGKFGIPQKKKKL